MRRGNVLGPLLLLSAIVAPAAPARCLADELAIVVDADFPGGNIIVDRIAGDQLYVHQDLRDTAGNWFYWYFRVRGAAGRTLTVHFTTTNPLGLRGPAVSADGGASWSWLGTEAVEGQTFRCAVPADADEIRFCFAFPYQAADLRRFLERHGDNPHLRVESLCRSEKGRDVPALRLGRVDGSAPLRVALTCRHHSCEMMASYVLEGVIEEVLADSEEGRWLREHVEFFIVPMVDVDGVEEGDQGKNRKPHDHNRDYEGEGIYASVRAIRERLPEWADGRLRMAIDLHCPGARGNEAGTVYFVGGQDEEIWQEVLRFSDLLVATQRGPIVFDGRSNLPFGQGWNTLDRTGVRKPFARWAATLPGVRVATTLETSYSSANGTAVTDETARALGHDLARTMRVYLGSLE